MKTVTNQTLRSTQGTFLNALSNTFHTICVNPVLKIILIISTFQAFVSQIKDSFLLAATVPAIKTLLVIDAFHTFFLDLGIDYKKCFQVMALAVFFFISGVIFYALFIRALDIEANAQDMVLIQYQESLKDLPNNNKGQ